ncbi:hypothetical protein K2173_002322 [Erythroxylum novogranatense]|uniref:DUF829 domain-containing protein n=1 Tax=Erythroxylum novogranatense TaxID=1862640 RepID=A0AAV8TBW0_9ROSI|nr:hypothetical protein K2173_002322 [Erythroxylum novogranatense]
MFGGGGRSSSGLYWGRKEKELRKGIVVLFGWVSIQEKQLKSYIDLYASLGWNSLACHAHFLTAFCPDRAFSLAFSLLSELIEELRVRACPVVFVAFSGGAKACMYKVFEIIQGTCSGHQYMDECQLVRNCFSGHIYDSCPVDFTSDFGAQFALHPAIQKMHGPSKFLSWVAKGITSGLDGLYLTRFEYQRAEYWQTLYSSVELGAPYLILCSEDDNHAPYEIVCEFAQRLQALGADVQLVKWNGSSHTGHYKHYPIQYRAAVTNLLEKAVSVYSHKVQHLRDRHFMDCTDDQISQLVCDLQKAAVTSNQSLRRVAVGPGDHFFVPSSAEYHSRCSEPLQDEGKERSVYVQKPPSMSAHSSVLGQMLFDVCVPRNVEGWDIRFTGSLNGQPVASAHSRLPFHGIKCIRRSRL